MSIRKLFGAAEDDETGLRKFSEAHGKKKSIRLISEADLKRWGRLTDRTGGQFTQKYMSPKWWGDSVESLQTAIAVVATYTPRTLFGAEYLQRTIAALRVAILKKIKAMTQAIVLRRTGK
jgi:hypothetical protein